MQQWRAKADAILTGSGTVLKDNPQLTLRDIASDAIRQPLRVIVDSHLRIPVTASIFQTSGKVMLANIISDKSRDYNDNTQLCRFAVNSIGNNTGVALLSLLRQLAKNEINEVHVEAGPTLNGSLFRENLLDEIVLYMAPVLLGDKARPLFELAELSDMQDKYQLDCKDMRQVGKDIRFVYQRVN